jgi:hypothetical protein
MKNRSLKIAQAGLVAIESGERWDVRLFLVRLMFCSALIMFNNKKFGLFSHFLSTKKVEQNINRT